jgi:hypothetical protein
LADLFSKLAEQIKKAHPGWMAEKMVLPNGTIIYAGETRGLIFATDGSVYQATGAELVRFLLDFDFSKLRRLI